MGVSVLVGGGAQEQFVMGGKSVVRGRGLASWCRCLDGRYVRVARGSRDTPRKECAPSVWLVVHSQRGVGRALMWVSLNRCEVKRSESPCCGV